MTARSAVVLVLSLLLCGCTLVPPSAKPAAPAGVVAPDPKPANEAQTAVSDAAADRLSKLSANVNAAATAPNIEASPVAVNELTVAQGRLSDVKPDPVEAAAAAERRSLVETGKADEARRNAELAAGQGRTDAAKIKELQLTADRLTVQHDADVAAYAAQAEANRISNQKTIDAAVAGQKKAEEARNDAVRKHQVVILNWIGTGFVVVAGAILGIGGLFAGFSLVVIKRLVPASAACAVIAVGSFATAQFIASRWFWPVVLGTVAIVLLGGGAWLYRSERVKQAALKAAAVTKDVVPVLDKAYEDGTETVDQLVARVKAIVLHEKGEGVQATTKDVMEELVFRPLSSKMDLSTKTTVKEIRAIPVVST